MASILDNTTWVAWLDHQDKWHCWEEGGYNCYGDKLARANAKALVGDSDGTASFIGTAKVAYCVHAQGRYQAIKMAKEAYRARMIECNRVPCNR